MTSRSQLIFNLFFSLMTPFVTFASYMPFMKIMGESSLVAKNKALTFLGCYWLTFLIVNLLFIIKTNEYIDIIKMFIFFLIINILTSVFIVKII